ncbi:TonB-dependent receptor plug domain-containing protein [Helicobacter sp. 23-1046]
MIKECNYPPPPETQDNNQVENKKDLQKVKLDKVTATAEREFEAYQSGAQIGREILDSNPSGNGDIGSILRILPNVQFDNAQNRSTTPGEIDPARISISGGLHYQNNFQLDGMNMNNDLDPAGSADWLGGAPGRSQGLAIDTNLLESITVQDSNISASYGGFTGGVVEANTRRPTKKYGANISYQFTQGNADPKAFSLTNYHLYGNASLESFLDSVTQSYNDNNSPFFTKHLIRASVESKVNDKFGIIASFATTQSFIPLRYNSDVSTSQATPVDPKDLTTRKQTQKRQIYNYFIKGYYDPSDSVRLELSYTYAPQFDYRFMSGTLGDFFSFDSGGHQVGFKTTWQNAVGVLTNTLSYSFLENSTILHGFEHTKYWITSSSKNWGRFGVFVREGGYAPTASTQHTLSEKIVQDFTPFDISITTHAFSAGLELGYQYAQFGYTQDYFFARNNGNQKQMTQAQQALCTGQYLEWCDPQKAYYSGGVEWAYGQYFGHVELYRKANVDLHNALASAWLEDDITIPLHKAGELHTRLGVRFDADSYMGKATYAPRFSLNYITPAPKELTTQITFGANRYYGRNIFAYALKAKQNSMSIGIARDNPNKDWYEILESGVQCTGSNYDNSGKANCITPYKDDIKFSKLKVPFVDELMAGIVQRVYNAHIEAKYIYRLGKDDIRYVRSDYVGLAPDSNYTTTYYTYTNEGKSYTDVVVLVVSHDNPLEFGGVKHYASFNVDWTNVKRNFVDYAESANASQIADDDIVWEGKVVPYSQRPASNFVRPFTLRLNTTHSFNIGKFKWLLNNFLRYRSSYKAVAKIHTAGANYDRCATNSRFCPSPSYDSAHNDKDQFIAQILKGAFSWDMRLGFEVDIWRGNAMYMNMDIFNLLNAKNPTIATTNYAGTSSSPTIVYEVGRQFWVQVGYKF